MKHNRLRRTSSLYFIIMILKGEKDQWQGYRYIIYCGCLVAKSCLTLCNPVDCSLPGSSIHGISQVRTLKQVAISFFRSPSLHRDRIYVSCVCLLHWQANSLLTGGNWEASLTFYPPIIVLSFQTNISVLLGVYMRSKVV